MNSVDSHSLKVLVILLGAIGDVTRALPLVTRLKSSWPHAHLTWAVEPASFSLVDKHAAIDRVICFERSQGFKAYCRFVSKIRMEHYDLVLDLQRHFKSGVTSFLSCGRRRVGFNRRNSREFNWIFQTETIPAVDHFSPKIEQFQLFGDYLGLAKEAQLNFALREHDELSPQLAAELSRATNCHDFVALLVGSTWQSRLWPTDHYASLVSTLFNERGLCSVVVGSSADAYIAKELAQKTPPGAVIDLCGKTSLAELAVLFRKMRFAVGSDSGPMHIADAVGLPVVSVWGSTSSRRSGPVASKELVIQSAIGCSPCYRRQCPGLATLCMESITPEMVLKKVKHL